MYFQLTGVDISSFNSANSWYSVVAYMQWRHDIESSVVTNFETEKLRNATLKENIDTVFITHQ